MADRSTVSLSSVVIRVCRAVAGGALDLRAEAGQITSLTAQDLTLRDNEMAGTALVTSGEGEITLRLTGGELVDNIALPRAALCTWATTVGPLAARWPLTALR